MPRAARPCPSPERVILGWAAARGWTAAKCRVASRPARIRRAKGSAMAKHRVFTISVASVYPHYITKAEKKGRTKAEVDEIICWLTGYSPKALQAELDAKTDFETFFAQAPALNPAREKITGLICGIRVEEIEDPLMRELRYLDKLIDELARGKKMEKILREG
jgi:hypothetical protein